MVEKKTKDKSNLLTLNRTPQIKGQVFQERSLNQRFKLATIVKINFICCALKKNLPSTDSYPRCIKTAESAVGHQTAKIDHASQQSTRLGN